MSDFVAFVVFFVALTIGWALSGALLAVITLWITGPPRAREVPEAPEDLEWARAESDGWNGS